MDQKSLTTTQLAATISSLLADIDEALATVPTLLDPALKRRGRRRPDRVQGPGQRRQYLQLQLAQAALVVAQTAATASELSLARMYPPAASARTTRIL